MRSVHGLDGAGFALVFASAVAWCACAAPGPSSSAPATSPASAAPAASRLRLEDPPANLGVVERYAWQTVIQLGEACQEGDVDGFLARVSRGFYRGYPALESALRTFVRDTTDRGVIVAVREVALDGDRVSVRAQWELKLVRRDGVPQALAGESVFSFLRSETSLRLLDFSGDPPFGIAGIPGLP